MPLHQLTSLAVIIGVVKNPFWRITTLAALSPPILTLACTLPCAVASLPINQAALVLLP